MNMKTLLWLLALAAVGWWIYQNPYSAWLARRQSGLQAGYDAATLNGYTTYNTQLYSDPPWQPILNFFRAGSYTPSQGNSSQATGAQQLNYSMQG